MAFRWSIFGAVLISGASSFATASTLVESFETAPDPICSDVPVLERGKFQECRPAYLLRELAAYVEAAEAAALERLIQERERIWDWLDTAPAANCDTLPELEKGKFAFQCAPSAVGGDVFSILSANLSDLQAQRESLARKIEELRENHARLSELQAASGGTTGDVSAADLDELLARLNGLSARTQLLETLGLALTSAPKLDGVENLILVEVDGAIDLLDAPEADGAVLLTTRGGETLVRINARSADENYVAVVHPSAGFAYVPRAAFNE